MKRSASKLVCLPAALLAASFCACTAQSDNTAAEAKQVEQTLKRIEQASPEDRAVLLDDLSRTTINSQPLARMRDDCVAAYVAFFEAKRQMRKARELTSSLEDAISQRNAASAGSEEILAEAAAASAALDASDNALARADALLESCTVQRHALKSK